MLKFENVYKAFDNKDVLCDISFKVEKGKTRCFIGPSGCGKTTILNLIAGLIEVDSGEIIGTMNKKISYVFQEDRLVEGISAIDNIEMALRNNGALNEFLEISHMKKHIDLYPEDMSGGMKKRVNIARAIAFDGDIILLDEPFNGIDEKMAETIAQFLKQILKDKICILVTHDKREAEMLDAEIISMLTKADYLLK